MESDLVLFASDASPATLDRMARRGEIRRIARGVYTRVMEGQPEAIVRRFWPQIAGRLFPDAVITDRSAPTGGPVNGVLYVAHSAKRQRTVELPGLTISARPGPPPESDDIRLPGGLNMASRARGLAENARESRTRSGSEPRTLDQQELAEWVDDLVHRDGLNRVLRYRDRAEELAAAVGASERKMTLLRQAIGAAAGTKSIETKSRALMARQAGRPFDRIRVRRFEILADALRRAAPQYRPLDGAWPERYAYEPFRGLLLQFHRRNRVHPR